MIRKEDIISKIVKEVLEQNSGMKNRFSPPSQQTDCLFRSTYPHGDNKGSCENCDKEQLVYHHPRDTRTPHIHYGLIASGDQVMKDSKTRDLLAQQHGSSALRWRPQTLWMCSRHLWSEGYDYCDTHKHNEWQGYAALTAAAYTKLLLSVVPVSRTDERSKKNNNRVYHWMVPLARNPRFVGRQDVIKKLEQSITVHKGAEKVAVTGLGGLGKTQVVLELAYRIRDRDRESSVFWLPCTSYEMVEQAYLNIAQILGLHDVKLAEVEMLQMQVM